MADFVLSLCKVLDWISGTAKWEGCGLLRSKPRLSTQCRLSVFIVCHCLPWHVQPFDGLQSKPCLGPRPFCAPELFIVLFCISQPETFWLPWPPALARQRSSQRRPPPASQLTPSNPSIPGLTQLFQWSAIVKPFTECKPDFLFFRKRKTLSVPTTISFS